MRWGEALWPGGHGPPQPPPLPGWNPFGDELPPAAEESTPWPEGHPLPLPQWGSPKDAAVFSSVEEYEDLAATVEHCVQQLLQAHQYNTVGNLLRFYEGWKTSATTLREFFRGYEPPITADHYTCVGLSLELLRRLDTLAAKFPKTAGKFYLVSCEEAVDHLQGYIAADPCVGTCEKEHVLVVLKIEIEGRRGLLMLDPGYHVARAVTVMKDCIYPHTGWFTQPGDLGIRKDYHYVFTENCDYVAWKERETRAGVTTNSESVIYVARPYLTPVNITERRNLVYNFRSWVARDTKGHLLAGMYFPLKEGGTVTLFYQDSLNGKQRIRINPSADFDAKTNLALKRCSALMDLPLEHLESILMKISIILKDRAFLREVLDVNRDIISISIDN